MDVNNAVKMSLINPLSFRWGPRKGNDKKKSCKNLTTLPPEILQMITEHLPPVDTAILALCNHALLRAIGTRHWSLLRPGKDKESNEEYRELFLTTLARISRPILLLRLLPSPFA